MSNSKYPNQIDTSAELPIVRNNLNEVGADSINSIRSAIIQIEKTLGLNPQGAIGNTVSSRLSKSLDASGSILKEALDKANVIYGPILNDNIAKTAAIEEEKLKLNFPTTVLQSQISYVNSIIDSLELQIKEISANLSSHLNKSASARHPATAISTTSFSGSSSESLKSIGDSNVQSVIENIISSHINYDGLNITQENNSHSSTQIYFDNSNTNSVISSSTVQGAIEDLVAAPIVAIENYKNYNNSNGVVRKANISDINNSSYGILIASGISITILKNLSYSKIINISLASDISRPDFDLKKSDQISVISNGIERTFQIYKVNYNPSDLTKISSFDVFGTANEDIISSNSFIYYKQKTDYVKTSLLMSAMQNQSLTSSSTVMVCNPGSASVISSSVKIGEITASNRYFDISINDGATYSIDCYVLSGVTLDAIVGYINEQFDGYLLPVLAYRVDLEDGGSEIAICSNVATGDSEDIYFKITRSSDDGIDSVGFSFCEDKNIYGKYSTSFVINGKEKNSLATKLKTQSMSFSAGLNVIETSDSALNLVTSGIKKGDIITILGSGQNISLKIAAVTESTLTISSNQLPSGFLTSSTDGLTYIVYNNTLDFSDYEFLKVAGSFGSTLFEIFADQDANLFYNPIAELETPVLIDSALITIVDVENKFAVEQATINYTQTADGYVLLSLDQGQQVKIVGDHNYVKLISNNEALKITVYVPSKDDLYSYIGSSSETSSFIYLFDSVDQNNNLVISQIAYNNFSSSLVGGMGSARAFSRLSYGIISNKDISNLFIETAVSSSTAELRSNGVVFGLEVLSGTVGIDGVYIVSIGSGSCYVGGRKFIFKNFENISTGINSSDTDKVYIGVDQDGNLIFESCDPVCNYPWQDLNVALLGSIELSAGIVYPYDQRLFISEIDLKILNSITVSSQPGMAHFTDLVKAIKYAKRFSQIFPSAGTPEIHMKSGVHTVNVDITTELSILDWYFAVITIAEDDTRKDFYNSLIKSGFWIDFPVSISGEGTSTKVKIFYNISASDGDYVLAGAITIPGYGFNQTGIHATLAHDRFYSGFLTLRNFELTTGGIHIIDLNNYDSLGNKYDFKLDIVGISKLNETTGLSISFAYYYSFSSIEISEQDDSVTSKGNISIRDSYIKTSNDLLSPINFTPLAASTRYKNINLSNNIIPSIEPITSPAIFDTSDFPPENDITAIGNLTPSVLIADKVDRISNHLVVGGQLTTSDIFFDTARKTSKTYWFYQSQIIVGTNALYYFNAYDPLFVGLISPVDRIYSPPYGTYTRPLVNVNISESVSSPIEILSGQKLTSVKITGNFTASSQIEVLIIKESILTSGSYTTVVSSGTLSSEFSPSEYLFTFDCSYKPAGILQHYLIINLLASSASQDGFSKAILTFESTNLSEILGISE